MKKTLDCCLRQALLGSRWEYMLLDFCDQNLVLLSSLGLMYGVTLVIGVSTAIEFELIPPPHAVELFRTGRIWVWKKRIMPLNGSPA